MSKVKCIMKKNGKLVELTFGSIEEYSCYDFEAHGFKPEKIICMWKVSK